MVVSNQPAKKGISSRTRTIITIILLLLTLVSPLFGIVGIIVMWVWTKWNSWLKVLITIPIALFAVALLMGIGFVASYIFLVRPYQANGQAMSPTYKNGAYIWTTPYNSRNMQVNRGDVIVFKAPTDPEKDFIKRVIALPGNTIMIQDGQVILNGQQLDESGYISEVGETYTGSFVKEGQQLSVPAGQYFVMGDNRPFSSDSREWGFVPQENIVSKAAFCYWNCNE